MVNELETQTVQTHSDPPGSSVSPLQIEQLRTLVLLQLILSGIYFIINIPFSIQAGSLVSIVVLIFIGLGLIPQLFALRGLEKGEFSRSGALLFGGLAVILGITSLLWREAFPLQVIAFVIIIALISTAYKPRAWWLWLGLSLLFVLLTQGVSILGLLPQADAPLAQYFTIIWITTTLWYVSSFFWAQNIRTRLLLTSIATAVLTAIAISAGAVFIGIQNGQEQALQKLELITTLREVEIDRWQDELQVDLARSVRQSPEFQFVEAEIQEILVSLIDNEPATEEFKTAEELLLIEFNDFIRQSLYYNSVYFMDRDGNVLVSTEEDMVNTNLSDTEYFQNGQSFPFINTPIYPPGMDDGVVYVARPITGDFGRLLGVVAGQANLIELNSIMSRQEESTLGETGETYLVSPDQTMLIGSRFLPAGNAVSSPAVRDILETRENFSGLYSNYSDQEVVGVYHWLPNYGVALVAEQTRSEAFQDVNRTILINAVIALLSVVVASTASLFIAENIGSPLSNLAQIAKRIAGGDLSRRADIQRQDEIGTLAESFNSMTIQLQDLIAGLEERVQERTLALAQRSSYLEASFEVGQTAASVLDQDQLINNVVEVIRDRFDLYYVGLFLLDGSRQWAVLKSGTGSAGRQMLAENHRLSFGGTSMIGQCVFQEKARIALDVGEEAVRFDNPLLPETRSEAALPLISRGQTIGALTVQSTQANAFDEDIVTVLQTMADQVAVSIDNARLFEETQSVIAETQRVYGEMSREAWRSMLRTEKGRIGFISQADTVHEMDSDRRPEMTAALQTGKVQTNLERSRIALPIVIRDQVVGIISGGKPDQKGTWSAEEIELLETLTEQLGIALDSARLFEETQKRAEQERIVGEITSRIRESLDLDSVLKTAASEISTSLNLSELTIQLTPEEQLSEKEESA